MGFFLANGVPASWVCPCCGVFRRSKPVSCVYSSSEKLPWVRFVGGHSRRHWHTLDLLLELTSGKGVRVFATQMMEKSPGSCPKLVPFYAVLAYSIQSGAENYRKGCCAPLSCLERPPPTDPGCFH